MPTDQESKREKFTRIAVRRTNQVLDGLRRLVNLANSYAYDFDQDDVSKIFDAIEERVRLARTKFEAELRFRDRGSRFDLH